MILAAPEFALLERRAPLSAEPPPPNHAEPTG